MLLSEIIAAGFDCGECKIIEERQFEYLGLTDSELHSPNLTFITNENFVHRIKPSVAMVFAKPSMEKVLNTSQYGVCFVENPKRAYFKLHNYLSNNDLCDYSRKKFATIIGNNCKISPLASISDENVEIGDNVTIEEFVVIRANTKIGSGSCIRTGVKLGVEGLQVFQDEEFPALVSHVGGIVIDERVEVQANTCIERAIYPWDNTCIGKDTWVGDMALVGHGAKIRNNVLVAGKSVVGGRTVVEENAWIGLSATVMNGISVGVGARVNIGAVATSRVPAGVAVTGNYAINHEKFIRLSIENDKTVRKLLKKNDKQ